MYGTSCPFNKNHLRKSTKLIKIKRSRRKNIIAFIIANDWCEVAQWWMAVRGHTALSVPKSVVVGLEKSKHRYYLR
jgi:hypothetical protein